MPRYKLTLEYDGGPFVGWQRQDNGLSVQAALEQAALRYSGETVTAHAAGRTDAGVHAFGQVAHIDLCRADPARKVREALNAHLRPHPVAVVEAEEVLETFHARFSAVERSYVYRILNRRAPAVIDAGKVWWVPQPLDDAAMHAAGQELVGQHDFTSFRAAECQAASPVKTLDELRVTRQGDHVEVYVRARSFLHHQVRNIVGTLSLVGLGRWVATDVRAALEARNRAKAGPTAPATGLYFLRVRYGSPTPPAPATPSD